MEDSGYKGINDFAIDLLPFPCKIIYNGDFETIEGNAKGFGPNGDWREGVSKEQET